MTVLPAPDVAGATRVLALAPAVATTVLSTAGFVLSLLPTLLPRPEPMQAVLTGMLVSVGTGLAQPVERLARQLLPGLAETQLRWSVLTLASGIGLGALFIADGWMSEARRAVGLSPVDDLYWPLALTGAVLLAAMFIVLGRGVRRLVRRVNSPPARAGAAVCVLLPVLAGSLGAGSLVSVLPFPGDDVRTLSGPASSAGGVRVYVDVDERETPEARADLAVRRMRRSGGFDREAVVVAFPTGTGWVNPEAVDGFERALHGDVATVAMQGGEAPSWVEMFLNRPAQEASARALFDAVSEHIATLPEGRRPDLHLYGESLGALLGQAVMAEHGASEKVCGVLWAGVPGGVELDRPDERVLSNADDPVVFWTPGTAIRRPDHWPESTPWLPGLSYVTTSLDLVVSLGSEPGHGHVYGEEQSWQLPRCSDAPGGIAGRPRDLLSVKQR